MRISDWSSDVCSSDLPLLGLMCLARPERAIRFGLICTIASVLGGLFGYAIGHFLYETVGQQILHALGLAAKFPVAACYLRDYGAEIILIKGATPIPFKLNTITEIGRASCRERVCQYV